VRQGVIKFFKKLFNQSSKLTINEKPLCFTERALSKIREHLASRPTGVQSVFTILVEHKKEGAVYSVGFEDSKHYKKTLHAYPIPLVISEKDEHFLQGSTLDYSFEDNVFTIYPDIEIEVLDTPNKNIIRVFINRRVISIHSELSEYAIDHNTYSQNSETFPKLIQTLFKTQLVESVYIRENMFSIEKVKMASLPDFEETIVEILMSHFEHFGSSLLFDERI
jgi:Fe-S cluster assembly iron-binding protein IscA